MLMLVFQACSDDDNEVYINPDVDSTATLSLDQTGPFVLSSDMAEETLFTASWTEPDFGFNAANPTYQILVDVAGNEFQNAQTVVVGTDLSYAFTYQKINTITQNLGLTPSVESTLELKLQALLGAGSSSSEVFNSTVQTITVTPYSSVLDLSTTWGIVGSGYNDWGATPDAPFYQTGTDGVFVAYVDLIDGEIKFRENSAWDNNYGDDGADGTLEAGGANIAVTAGSYKVTLNLNDLTYTIEAYSLGIVGSGYNDWGATPDFKLNYDSYSDTFKGTVALIDGEIKFRLNNEWNGDWGGENGTLVSGGANIAVTAGNYIVTVDFNQNTYTLEAIDNIWGIVGSAAPNGWDGPDAQMMRDWSVPDNDVWTITLALADGEIKFRANNDWNVNYGDDNADGTIEAGGANIAVTAGTYTIKLDIDAGTYSIE